MQIHGQYMPLNDGYTLHVVTAGSESASPLLMLHCWTGNWTQWEPTMSLLEGQFQFIVPDLLGFGSSSKPVGDYYQIDEQANRVRQIVRDLGYEKVSIIGHSMGGMIALTFAGMFPDMVDKLVVNAPAVTGRIHPRAALIAQMNHLGRRGLVQPMELSINLGKLIPPIGQEVFRMFFAHPKRHADAVNYWGHQGITDGQQYTAPWAEKAIQDWDTRPLLHSIQARTLAIWGDRDETIPTGEVDVLAEYISDFRQVIISDCGHFPMIEGWDTYSQAVTDFLID